MEIKHNFKAWQIQPLSNLQQLKWRQVVEHLLGWAILAPSAHNKQGWSVKLDETEKAIYIWPVVSDIGSITDEKGRETYIGVGCFAQNLIAALEGYRITFKSEIITNKTLVGIKIVVGDLYSGKLKNNKIFETMRSRRAYRGKYDREFKLSSSFVKKINSFLNDKDLSFQFITDSPTKLLLAEAQATADRVVILNSKFRHDLGSHLVANDTNLTRVMPGNTFGLSDDSSVKVHDSLISNGQFDGDFAAGFANLDRDSIVDASALGIISVAKDEPEYWIKAGILAEKIWLLAEEYNLGVGVMAAMVESIVHNVLLKTRLREKKRPTFIFRIGKPLEVYPHSPRITVPELFIS